MVNSFWRKSENWRELSHKSSNYWQQPAVLLRLNNESKPKLNGVIDQSLLSPLSQSSEAPLWSQNKISKSPVSECSGLGSGQCRHLVTSHRDSSVSGWWIVSRGHISIQPPQSFHTNIRREKNHLRLFNFPRCETINYQINRGEECEDKLRAW